MSLNVVSTLDQFFKIKSLHLTESYEDTLMITHLFHSTVILSPRLPDNNDISLPNKDEVQLQLPYNK